MAALKPKKRPRGDYFVALVVGGNDIYHQMLKKKLAEQGVHVRDRWTPEPNLARKPFPADVDVVIVAPDNRIGRNEREAIMWNARKSAFGCLAASASQAVDLLTREGFRGPMLDIEALEKPEVAPDPELEMMAKEIAELEESERQVQNEESKEEPVAVMVPDTVRRASLVGAGEKVRKARVAKGWSTTVLGKKIGVSGSAISNIEKGNAKPSNALCTALERLLELPENTIPRLATRQNHRIKLPPVGEVTPVAPPIEVAPAPPPSPPEPQEPPRSLFLPIQLEPFPAFLVDVAKLQAAMKDLGVTRLEITSASIQVTQ